MKPFYNIFDLIGSKRVIVIFSLIVLCHLVWEISSLRSTYQLQSQGILKTRVDRITHLVYLLDEVPSVNQYQVLSDAAPISIFEKFSLTPSPEWPSQIVTNSRIPVENTIRNNQDMSLQIKSGQWLNVHFEPALHGKWLKLTLMTVLETALLIGLLLFFFIIHYFTQSLLQFKRATERLGIDFKMTPLSVEGPMVLREAGKAINEMQRRMQNLVIGRTRILAAISHDLRTPITRMVLRTQFLLDPSLQQSFNADLEEMQSMVKETLAFAKNDSANEKKVSLDLVSLCEVVCDESCEIGKNVSFKAKVNKAAFIGHALALKRALNNIIDNAVRYGKKAEVELFFNKRVITIVVKDDGPGIQEAEMNILFLPFARGKAFSSDKGLPGTGLGLAIAYDIIQAHGGKIFLENRREGGLMVKIQFSPHETIQDDLALQTQNIV